MIRKQLQNPLTLSWHGQTIPILDKNTPYKYLGVLVTIHGDTTQAWQKAQQRFENLVQFISRRAITTKQKIILINRVAHAQLGYILKHTVVNGQDLETLDNFVATTLSTTCKTRTNSSAQMWFVDWQLQSVQDLAPALRAAVIMDSILNNPKALPTRIYTNLMKQRITLPLLLLPSPAPGLLADMHEEYIPLQEITAKWHNHLTNTVKGPWQQIITQVTNGIAQLIPNQELLQLYPSVPEYEWSLLRLRLCESGSRSIKPGWLQPTLTPFLHIDSTMTTETHQGQVWQNKWIAYTDGGLREGKPQATSAAWFGKDSPFNRSFPTWGEQTIGNAELQAIEYVLHVTPRQQNLLIVPDSQYAIDICDHCIEPTEWKRLPNALTLKRIHDLLHTRRASGALTAFQKVYSHIAEKLKGKDEQLKMRVIKHYQALEKTYGKELALQMKHGNHQADMLAQTEYQPREHRVLLTGGPRFQLTQKHIQITKSAIKAYKYYLQSRREKHWTERKGKRSKHHRPPFDTARTIKSMRSTDMRDNSLANYMHKVLQSNLYTRAIEKHIADTMPDDPENEHSLYMKAVYSNQHCAFCRAKETNAHVAECEQHEESRNGTWTEICELVASAGGNPNMLPDWFNTDRDLSVRATNARPACFSLIDTRPNRDIRALYTLGLIPAGLPKALIEIGIHREDSEILADDIAFRIQRMALNNWRDRCYMHNKVHNMTTAKAKARKTAKQASRKRKLNAELAQAGNILPHLQLVVDKWASITRLLEQQAHHTTLPLLSTNEMTRQEPTPIPQNPQQQQETQRTSAQEGSGEERERGEGAGPAHKRARTRALASTTTPISTTVPPQHTQPTVPQHTLLQPTPIIPTTLPRALMHSSAPTQTTAPAKRTYTQPTIFSSTAPSKKPRTHRHSTL